MDSPLKQSPRIHRAQDNQFSWVSPPLDGSLTVSELYDFHYVHNPDYPVFRYAEDDAVKQLQMRDVVPAAYAAARFIAKSLGIDIDAGQRLTTKVAILASSDTITSITTVIGMLRADITFFIISPNHSPASIAHLLTSTPVSHFLVCGERWKLAEAAVELLNEAKPTLCRLPTYPELYQSSDTFTSFRHDPKRKDSSVTRYILHSSATTSLPKPISRNDRAFLQIATVPLYGERDLLGQVFGCFGKTLHHGSGLDLIGWLNDTDEERWVRKPTTGLIMATFPPAAVGVELGLGTIDTVWDAFLAIKPDYLYPGQPNIIEEWLKDAAKLPFLQQLTGGIIYVGAPLRKTLGDALASGGCSIHTLYGSTEIGPYSMMFQENPGMDWDHFRPNPLCDLEFVPLGDGRFEMIAVGETVTELSIMDTTFNGKPAFRSKDMVEPHPTLPNRWKVLGRLDDQIVLTGGNKTIPGPLEDMICNDPHIRSAVMFGFGKCANGVLIDLEPNYAFDPKSTQDLEKYRDLIWPAIEAVNNFGSRTARIPRELVGFAAPEKPFEYSLKGQPKRAPILKAYAEEIEAMYMALEENAQVGPPKASYAKGNPQH